MLVHVFSYEENSYFLDCSRSVQFDGHLLSCALTLWSERESPCRNRLLSHQFVREKGNKSSSFSSTQWVFESERTGHCAEVAEWAQTCFWKLSGGGEQASLSKACRSLSVTVGSGDLAFRVGVQQRSDRISVLCVALIGIRKCGYWLERLIENLFNLKELTWR